MLILFNGTMVVRKIYRARGELENVHKRYFIKNGAIYKGCI